MIHLYLFSSYREYNNIIIILLLIDMPSTCSIMDNKNIIILSTTYTGPRFFFFFLADRNVCAIGNRNGLFAPHKINSIWVQPVYTKIKKYIFKFFSDSPFAPNFLVEIFDINRLDLIHTI